MDASQDQRVEGEEEDVQIISSINHDGQGSYPQFQHLSVKLSYHKSRKRFKERRPLFVEYCQEIEL